MKKIFSLFSLMVLVAVIGCTVDQAGRVEGWLSKPASTQPNAPSNEQAIRGTVDTVGGFTGPWGSFGATLLNLGLIAFHEYASRKRTAATQELVLDASIPPANQPK